MNFIAEKGIQLQPWFDLRSHLEGYEPATVTLAHDNSLLILAAKPPRDLHEHKGIGIFPKIHPHLPSEFLLIRYDGNNTSKIFLHSQNWNYHHAQVLPNDELLLVCSRSMYRKPDDFDLNGQVFASDGIHRRSFLIGDGVQEIQSTADGCIWISFFDEGIYGNYGWQNPIGASGLIRMDQFGKIQYQFVPPEGLGPIDDCYALNVASPNDTWLYYYSDFPLVRVVDNQVVDFWRCPVHGAKAFCVARDYIVMQGGYDEPNVIHCLRQSNRRRLKHVASYNLIDEDNLLMKSPSMTGRGPYLLITNNSRCYLLSARQVIDIFE
jgi:hypothetical protein